MEEKLVLFYPFEYQDRTVDWDTLKKLSWATQDEVAALEAHNSRRIDVQKKNKGEKNRKNFVKPVKIRQTDVARLQPGGWLNDTLIDFWCLWVRRSDLAFEVHCFSSLFFEKLAREGFSGVERWCVHLNVFGKKMIFVPVCEKKHWSLCVVVNQIWGDGVRGRLLLPHPTAIVYFLDSKKGVYHDDGRITKIVINWLEVEWKRDAEEVTKGDSGGSGRTAIAFHVCLPTVPQQDNTDDCGVFVCKYVLAMYSLRRHTFSKEDAAEIVEGSRAFTFGGSEVARLRVDMNEVITLLSGVYQRSMAVNSKV